MGREVGPLVSTAICGSTFAVPVPVKPLPLAEPASSFQASTPFHTRTHT